MKRIILFSVIVAMALFLNGCTKYYPSSAFLELKIAPQREGIYDGTQSANIFGYDKRPAKELIYYMVGDDNDLRLPGADAPQDVVTRSLTEGLTSQGLVADETGKTDIGVEIDTMVVKVTKDFWTYESTAATRLSVTVRNAKGVFTKKYARESLRTSFFKPEPSELEKMLGEQVSEIVNAILQDDEISRAILAR
jgi:uncharacterized lipoprotein